MKEKDGRIGWFFDMRIAILTLVLACAGLTTAAAAPPPVDGRAAISLSGSDWQVHDDVAGKGEKALSTSAWISATVPGNIQADLEAAHLLKPLWYGAGDPRLEESPERTGGIARTSRAGLLCRQTAHVGLRRR